MDDELFIDPKVVNVDFEKQNQNLKLQFLDCSFCWKHIYYCSNLTILYIYLLDRELDLKHYHFLLYCSKSLFTVLETKTDTYTQIN